MQCLEPARVPIRENGKIIEWLEVPCGHCESCLDNYKSDWAFRCLLELPYHSSSCMITLTFSDEGLLKHNLEYGSVNSLEKREIQLFLKRLRKYTGLKLRYFAVGEYGENNTHRPHYHILLYGIDADNPIFDGKVPVYKKGMLHHFYIFNGISAWRYGQVEVSAGKITPGAVSYMLKYFLKQSNKEVTDRNPMFVMMSRKPGIGYLGIKEHFKTLVNNGYASLGVRKVRIPRYVVDKIEDLVEFDFKDEMKLDHLEYYEKYPRKKINKKQWLINKQRSKR